MLATIIPLFFAVQYAYANLSGSQTNPKSNNLTLPSSTLPPPSNLSLVTVALGVGHQNYTCNSTTGKYSSNVAFAELFDATGYLFDHPNELSTLSGNRLQQYIRTGEHMHESNYKPVLRPIGKHYFQPSIPPTPVFELCIPKLFLSATRVASQPAPDSMTAIDWLYLVDNGRGQTQGLKAVYRVETAGGVPESTCAGTEETFVPYAAQYWFYA